MLGEFTSHAFACDLIAAEVLLPDSSWASGLALKAHRIFRVTQGASDPGIGVAESKPRGYCVNVVTLDLTLHCYNLPRFFRQVLRLAS
jgi:hypothetical protein